MGVYREGEALTFLEAAWKFLSLFELSRAVERKKIPSINSGTQPILGAISETSPKAAWNGRFYLGRSQAFSWANIALRTPSLWGKQLIFHR